MIPRRLDCATRDFRDNTHAAPQAHAIYIAMGVLQAWVGRGIGRSLLEALERWAQSKGLHLELMVNYNNERAIRLYEKLLRERGRE
jgi:GNAT superfamily N-acetyltransferase